MMKAITYSTYGAPSVLKITEVDSPSINQEESLVRNYASTVSSGDVRARAANPWLIRLFFGLFKPKNNVLGQDFSGILIRTTKDQKIELNDKVIGSTGLTMGGHAEYIKINAKSVIAKAPYNWSFEESATLPFGGMTALYFLKQLPKIENGKILIHGASGAIGSYAVQIAKHMGYHVTGVCSSKNIDLVSKLGADRVIDYRKQDYTQLTNEFDAVFTTVGKSSYAKCKSIMKESALYVSSDTPMYDNLRDLFGQKKKHHQLILGVVKNSSELLEELVQMAEKGHLTPVIDKSYNYTEAISAHEYVDSGHKTGAVIINF